MSFAHQHAVHCESGVASALARHHGLPLSEAMAFGLSSAMTFAYLPFVKVAGQPLVSFRQPPRAVLRGLKAPLGASFAFETFRSPEAGQARLDALLAQGEVVGLQTSVYWLPYFPPDMRFHFNAHNVLAYGKDGDDYLLSDPVFEAPVRCASADLQRARFARGLLAPKGLLYHPRSIAPREIDAGTVNAALAKTARRMLAPVPIAGVRGMRRLARAMQSLPVGDARSTAFVGHVVRMQEEIGTGGAGFRFLYAAFLQEAAERVQETRWAAFAERLIAVGDHWRGFALRAARMVKGRDAFDGAALAELLRAQAAQEEAFFRELKAAAR